MAEENYINQRREQEAQQQRQSNLSWLLPWAAGIGAIAVGAKLLKSGLSEQGNLVANMLHFLGHPTSLKTQVGKLANTGASTPSSGTHGIRHLFNASYSVTRNELQLGPIDLIRDVASSMDILGRVSSRGVRESLSGKLTEYINRKHVNFGNHSSFFSKDLERVTIGEVLDNQETWYEVIGRNQWNSLRQGVEAGLVGRSSALDKNIYKNSSGVIKDTRLRSVFMKPVQDLNYDYGLVPKIDVFGQFNVFQSLFGERAGVGVLGSSRTFKGPRFFIDGNIFGYSRNSGGVIEEKTLATNQRLRRIGDKLEPIRAAKEGRIGLQLKVRTGWLGRLVSAAEGATGVGTSFSSRRSFISKWFVDPVAKFNALRKGQAVIAETGGSSSDYAMKLVDQISGAEFPEFVTESQATNTITNIVNFGDLKWHQKLSALFLESPRHAVVRNQVRERFEMSPAGAARLGPEDFIGSKKGSGGFTIDRGNLPDTVSNRTRGEALERPRYYAAPASRLIPGVTSTRDFASYLAFRTSHLASDTLLGVSYAPAASMVGNLARVAAVPMVYGAMLEGIEYGDYLTEKLTGISPKKAVASIYADLRVGQQFLREAFGIQQALASSEESYPGSVDSGLGFLARNVAAPVGVFSFLSRRTSIGKAAAAAGAIFGLIGGVDPGQTSQALQEEYSGERKVAVRKGRFWGMGTAPFEGGDVARYDYSWYHKLMSDYQYKSVYGSKDEYFNYHSNFFGVPLPTPTNLLGLKNLLNPYRLEEINKNTRPYEISSNMFENVPVFGPLLASTIGKILKPSINRESQIVKSGVLPPGLDATTARDLGISEMNSTAPDYSDPISRLKKMANVASEPLGVYKFAMEFFGVKFDPTYTQRAESAMINSPGRNFYGMQLGGMLGQSEFLRRFMLSDYSITANTAALVNRVGNSMPTWLPGSKSLFKRDQTYFIDYTAGDPFLKLEDAESRLPGRGYEALNELHSSKPGVYDAVDRLLVLADVAPFSQALASYEQQVGSMDLDDYWRGKVDRALQYTQGMTSVDNRYPRHVDAINKINEDINNPLYDLTRNIYDFVTHDVLAEIPIVGSKLAPFMDPYEKYRRTQIEGSEFASWFNPYEDIVRPSLSDAALSNPIMGAMKGVVLAGVMTGPLKFMNPFANFSNAGLHSAFSARAMMVGGTAGAGLSVGRTLMDIPDNYVPEHVVDESNATEYLDKLLYLKSRSLQEFALSQGNSEAAAQFGRAKSKSMVAATSPETVRSSLPKASDKKYFDYFVNVREDRRQDIVDGVTPYMATALNKVWSNQYSSADAETESYFSNRQLPSNDWLGWHPSVDAQSMKLKVIEHGLDGISDNYHRYGFYESHERTLRQNYPDLWSQSMTFTSPPDYDSPRVFFQTQGAAIAEGLGSSTVSQNTAYGARYTTRLSSDRTRVMSSRRGGELR